MAMSGLLEEKVKAAKNFARVALATENEGNAGRFFDGGGWQALVALAYSHELDIQNMVTAALYNLAGEEGDSQKKIIDAGGLKPLLAIAAVKSTSQNAASWAVVRLSGISSGKTRMVREGGLPHILQMVASEDPEVQLCGTSILANITDSEMASFVIKQGGLQALVRQLDSKQDDVQLEAVIGLANIASRNEETQQQIVHCGGLSSLIKLVSSGDVAKMKAAIVALANIALCDTLQAGMVASGVLAPLLSALQDGSNDIKREVVRAVGNLLSSTGTIKDQILKMGWPSHLLDIFMKESEEMLLCETSRALSNLAHKSDDRQLLLVQQKGLLERLISMIQCNSLDLQRSVMRLINTLSANDTIKLQIVNLGGLPGIICLAESTDPSEQCQYFAAACLANLSQIDESKQAIVDHGGLRPIVQMASSRNEELRLFATWALAGLATCDSNRERVVMEGGLVPLLQLAKHENVEFLRMAAAALANLAVNASIRAQIGSGDGIATIVNILKSPDMQAQLYACWALADLSEDVKLRTRIVEAGAIPYLQNLFNSGAPMMQCEISRLFFNLKIELPAKLASVRAPSGDPSVRRNFGESLASFECDFTDLVIGERIGIGAFGEVFKGTYNGQGVAIKKLLRQNMSDEDFGDFIAEVRFLSQLHHSSILRFVAACTTPPHLCIVTELVPQGSLSAILHNPRNKIEWKTVVSMALETAEGMAYLHGHEPPIVHRDLKSENLLIDNWHVKVADFGMARVKVTSHTMSQCGTPKYMAPEILRNEPYDESCDVYSFGVVLWEMFARAEPYADTHPVVAGLRIAFLGLRPEIPAGCPQPEYKTLIQDCWKEGAFRPKFSECVTRLAAMLAKL